MAKDNLLSSIEAEALYLLSHGQILCRARFHNTRKACCRIIGEGYAPLIIHSATVHKMLRNNWIRLHRKTKSQDQYVITTKGTRIFNE